MKKRIIPILLVVALVCVGAFALVGCKKENKVPVYVDYQIVDSYSAGASIEVGNLLTKPSDPTFIDNVFNAGIGGIYGGYADFEFPLPNPRMGAGYDANKDYLFIGWYKEPACIRPWVFSEDRIYVTTHIYAKWAELPL